MFVSLKAPQIVWGVKFALRRLCQIRGEICFKEIVSNTRLDLNHSSFTHLACEFLIICKYLLIYTISFYYFCLSHLFVLLLIFRSVYCFFYFITKVNCWNIFKKSLLIYDESLRCPVCLVVPIWFVAYAWLESNTMVEFFFVLGWSYA